MCEQYVARAAEPFRIDELWPFTERLERFGMAGFGWGAAWVTPDGTIDSPPGRRGVRGRPPSAPPLAPPRGANEPPSLLLHVRRPSKLSTLQMADTQPFLDARRRFAFSHN